MTRRRDLPSGLRREGGDPGVLRSAQVSAIAWVPVSRGGGVGGVYETGPAIAPARSDGPARRRPAARSARQRRRGLDAVAALAGEPEEALGARVEAADRRAVRARRCAGPPSGGRCGGSSSVVAVSMRSAAIATSSSSGCASHGAAVGLVGGRDQQPAGVGLEVEVLADVDHQRPGGEVDVRAGDQAPRCAAWAASPSAASPASAATGRPRRRPR